MISIHPIGFLYGDNAKFTTILKDFSDLECYILISHAMFVIPSAFSRKRVAHMNRYGEKFSAKVAKQFASRQGRYRLPYRLRFRISISAELEHEIIVMCIAVIGNFFYNMFLIFNDF